jgi:AcrR family transcriptional regulator
MGPETSATREQLMNAVEAVMRDEGYAALSARRVAAKAGLKYQIVFYYFETMDDLLLATYRRRMERLVERTRVVLRSERPLHALWQTASDPADAALSLEYIAMSNHNQLIRSETIAFGEKLRRMVAEGMAPRLQGVGPDPSVFTPFGLTVAISSMGGLLGFESAMGLSGGHAETRAIVEWCLQQLEPDTAREARGNPVASN